MISIQRAQAALITEGGALETIQGEVFQGDPSQTEIEPQAEIQASPDHLVAPETQLQIESVEEEDAALNTEDEGLGGQA